MREKGVKIILLHVAYLALHCTYYTVYSIMWINTVAKVTEFKGAGSGVATEIKVIQWYQYYIWDHDSHNYKFIWRFCFN